MASMWLFELKTLSLRFCSDSILWTDLARVYGEVEWQSILMNWVQSLASKGSGGPMYE